MEGTGEHADSDATLVGGGLAQGEALTAGDHVAQFRVINLLGVGGMGEVYVAEDERLGRQVALKSVRVERRLNEGARERFRREAQVLSSLEHPHICRIYDYIEADSGDYIVLELLSGRPLSKAASTLSKRDKLRVAEQIADALIAAHASGIIHRDLKPENVMVTDSGAAKVLDFGIARPIESKQALSDQAEQGAASARLSQIANAFDSAEEGVIGTPLYMSPEQAAGAAATSASDMYCFGLMLQEVLTGLPPRDPAQSLRDLLECAEHAEHEPVRLADRGLRRLIANLTDPTPSRRPSAGQTAQRLRHLLARPVRYAIAATTAIIVIAASVGTAKYTIDLDNERSLAIEARDDAEDQIEFVVSDLREKLAAVGRMEILEDAAKRVLAYYQRRGVEGLSHAERLRYARGYLLVGEVHFDLGQFDTAERALQDQIELLEGLLQDTPDNGDAIKALGAGHFWLGFIEFDRGNTEAALAYFETYLALGRRLVALDDSNPEWLIEEAYGQTNLGAVHNQLGNQEKALEHFQASYNIKRTVVDLEPENPDRKEDLASGLAWLMVTQDAAGELAKALETAGEIVGLREQVLAIRPKHADSKRVLSYSLSQQARLLREAAAGYAEPDDAAWTTSLRMQKLASELYALEPGNPAYRRELAVAQRHVGAEAWRRADTQRAQAELNASRMTFEDLVAAATDNAELRVNLLSTGMEQIRLHLAMDKPSEAARLAEDLRDHARQLRSTDTAVRIDLARFESLVGQTHAANDRQAQAHEAYTRGLADIRLVESSSIARKTVESELLLRLGHLAEAEPIVQNLQALDHRWRWDLLLDLLRSARSSGS